MNPIQAAIDAGEIPPRPSAYHPSIRREIAECMANDLGMYLGKPAETLIRDLYSVYTPNADGYELAKALDDNYAWNIDTDLVNILDDSTAVVTTKILDAAQAEWVKTHEITEPFPPGTRVRWIDDESVQTGVVMHSQHSYPGRSSIKNDTTPSDEPYSELIGWERLELLSEQIP